MASWMRKIIPISVLLFCFVIAVPVQGAIVAKTPSYSTGDYWGYGDVGVTTEDLKISVLSTTKTFNGVTCIEEKASVYSGGTWVNSSVYYRASDGANAGSYVDMSTSGMVLKVTTIAKPITSQYNYPLTNGKKWHVTFVQQSTTEMTYLGYSSKTISNSTYDWNFTVVGEEKVTVAAGTFDTLKITSSTGGGSVSTTWYSPKVGNMVKSESTSGGSTSTTELKTYKFQNAPSGGGGGGNNDTGGILGGMMLYVILLVIVVVVILVVVVMMMKKKKGAPVPPGMVAPAAQPGQPMAPAAQPQAPPVQQPQYQPPQQVQQPQYQQPAQQYQPPAQPVYDPNQPYTPPPQAQQYAPQQQYAPPPQAPQQYPPQPPQY